MNFEKKKMESWHKWENSRDFCLFLMISALFHNLTRKDEVNGLKLTNIIVIKSFFVTFSSDFLKLFFYFVISLIFTSFESFSRAEIPLLSVNNCLWLYIFITLSLIKLILIKSLNLFFFLQFFRVFN
jgi:hypothetical protein